MFYPRANNLLRRTYTSSAVKVSQRLYIASKHYKNVKMFTRAAALADFIR